MRGKGMMGIFSMTGIAIIAAACLVAVAGGGDTVSAQSDKTIEERLAVYAPVKISVPWDLLDENETAALENIYRAAVIMDELR